jgi:hypothetical protein
MATVEIEGGHEHFRTQLLGCPLMEKEDPCQDPPSKAQMERHYISSNMSIVPIPSVRTK